MRFGGAFFKLHARTHALNLAHTLADAIILKAMVACKSDANESTASGKGSLRGHSGRGVTTKRVANNALDTDATRKSLHKVG